MPYINLPFLRLNDEKYVHTSAPAPPDGKNAVRRGEGLEAGFSGPAALVRRTARALRRGLAVRLAASQDALHEQEMRQLNLLTYYVNSRSGQ